MIQPVENKNVGPKKTTIVARLSIIDQHIPDIYENESMFFETSNADAATQALQKGLDETVAAIPFLAGEIYQDAANGNGYVLEWAEDHARVVMEDYDGSDLPSMAELKQQRFPLHMLGRDIRPSVCRPSIEPRQRKKAFGVSCTRVTGGLIISHTFHHAFVDGYGLHRIIAKWASLTARSGQNVSISPREPLSRVRLDHAARLAQESFAGSTNAVSQNGAAAKPTPKSETPQLPSPVLASELKILVISEAKLQQLNDQIRGLVSQPFSQNTLLLALIWQSMSVVRRKRLSGQTDLQDTKATSEVGIIVDARRMLEDYLPGSATWLGNQAVALSPRVLFPVTAFGDRTIRGQDALEDSDESSDLASFRYYQSLPRLIKRLSSAHSGHTLQHVAASLSAKLDKAASKDFDLRTLRRSELELNGLQLIFSSIWELEAYHDWGSIVGRQLAIRTPGQGLDGLCIVLPRKRGPGFIEAESDEMEVQIFLREDDLREMAKDDVLRQLWCADPI